MKIINHKKKIPSQFYWFPSVIVSHSRTGRRIFLVWLYWSIEL